MRLDLSSPLVGPCLDCDGLGVIDDGFCVQACERCQGQGMHARCPHCQGFGLNCGWCENGDAVPCRACGGSGVDPTSAEGEYCQRCGGEGQDPDRSTLDEAG
jgi:hypothetical protein